LRLIAKEEDEWLWIQNIYCLTQLKK
jgi:hypothetical protein